MTVLLIFQNKILIPSLLCWLLVQLSKVVIEYIKHQRWDWSLLIRAGGMPSTHSAIIACVTHAIGLSVGFDSPLFGLAFVIAIIVIYDATGIRRQAGKHAEIINTMITDLASGHPLKQEQLREVLGHTPKQALVGTIVGILIAQISWMIWR